MFQISVIIPVYNSEMYIKECIESILRQNFTGYEILVINDGSTDNTLEILKEYEEKIKIFSIKNSGASFARNYGIKKANGEYILTIDSDDFIKENYLKSIYDEAKKYDADVVITDFYKYKNNSFKRIVDYAGHGLIANKENYLDNLIKTKNTYHSSLNKLIKKELFIKFPFPDGIFIGDDLDCILKIMIDAKRIVKLNKEFYCYRIGQNNTGKFETFKGMLDHKFVHEDLINFLKQRDMKKEYIQYLEYRMIKGSYIPIFHCKVQFDNKEYMQALEFIKTNIQRIINLDGFKLLRLKYKILFYMIRKNNDYKKIVNFLSIFVKFNTLISGKKIKTFGNKI